MPTEITHISSAILQSSFQLMLLSCLVALTSAAPMAEGEADSQFLGGFNFPAVGPAPNCVTETEVLVTQVCTPGSTEVCSAEVVETEEIEYEKICKDVVDVLCDAPVPAPYHAYAKREAEADPQFGFAPVHAVGKTVTSVVKHACREIVSEHCVDSPRVVAVPVEVEHCHTVTKVACEPVEHQLPRTVCQPVETTHVSPYGFPNYGYGYGK